MIFDDADCQRIWHDYNSPDRPSLRDLSAKYYAGPTAIRRAIHRTGNTARGHDAERYNVAMICNDWNGDIPTARICRVYGIPDSQHLSALVSQWRKRGWAFKYGRDRTVRA